MYFDKLKSKIYKTNIGLLPITKDKRDLGAFNFWGLGGRTYKRKSDSNIIKYLFPAISQQYNTCGWAGEVGMKEIDEKVMLSPRSFVLAGKMLGYISGDGFSNSVVVGCLDIKASFNTSEGFCPSGIISSSDICSANASGLCPPAFI